jgi:dTDP-4-dehydrorhamnose reductase
VRILITGSDGMLGRDLCAVLAERHTPIPLTRAEADVTDLSALAAAVRQASPEVVIHAAAQTSVDTCEGDPDGAYRVNAWGAWAAAAAAEQAGARFVLISTDFVFDGTAGRPYTEFDPVNPLSVYGASKAAAEQVCRQACRRCLVVRTQWLFGRHGRSFPRTILEAAAAGRPLRVVTDQVGAATYTRHLAAALAWLCEQPCDGTYHLASTGAASRWEWAKETLRLAGWDDVPLQPITSAEWPAPAPRPAFTVLRNYALELRGVNLMPSWQEGMAAFITELRAAGELPLRK